MVQKAGFVQRYRCYVYDRRGYPCQIVELTLHGVRYGIRDGEVRRALAGRGAARVEALRQDWRQYLDGTVGHARRSGNARGLVIELATGTCFSVSAESLREVLDRRRAYASVIEIAPRPPHADSTRQRTLAGIA
ncbi:hypothetical protein FGU65_08220 [Methanoculleus sp. FWC-SCC1]|uniref:Uncharacterized protein n=1 Tax=Methanoculleus frigidifontis TaxID=2584085 RepID=A0ABT8MAG2_9EURY|nr:hypothetical protein [Methanoculleus sp. FWC-SCC1]MDN7024871.1 hypothetical protein [Methanoculleus sp. FWC-SCC1]